MAEVQRSVAALEAVRADPYLADPRLDDAHAVRLSASALDVALARERAAVQQADAKTLEAAQGLLRIGLAVQSRPG